MKISLAVLGGVAALATESTWCFAPRSVNKKVSPFGRALGTLKLSASTTEGVQVRAGEASVRELSGKRTRVVAVDYY